MHYAPCANTGEYNYHVLNDTWAKFAKFQAPGELLLVAKITEIKIRTIYFLWCLFSQLFDRVYRILKASKVSLEYFIFLNHSNPFF